MGLPPRQTRPPTRSARRPAPVRPLTMRRARGPVAAIWLAVVLSVVGIVGYYVYDRTFGALKVIEVDNVLPPINDAVPAPPILSAPFNVLLIGADFRTANPEEGARSDTLIVARIDPINKTVGLLSIPRDTQVDLIGPDDEVLGRGKINAAYAYGYTHPDLYPNNIDREIAGATLAQQTAANFLGIDIPYYAQINFQGFQTLVDRLGGITLDVPHAILDAEYPTDDYGYMRLFIPAGLQRMDGVTALRYARTRHADNDFGRAKRQQQVIEAIMGTAKGGDWLDKLDAASALLETMQASARTTMPLDVSSLRGMVALARELGPDRIRRYVLEPSTDGTPHIVEGCGTDICWEPQYVAEVVAKFAGTTPISTAPETATVQVWNGKGVRGVAAQVTFNLTQERFATAEPTDAPTDEYPNTLILDYTGKPSTAARLAAFLKINPKFVVDKTADRANAPFGVDIVLIVGDDYEAGSGVVDDGTASR